MEEQDIFDFLQEKPKRRSRMSTSRLSEKPTEARHSISFSSTPVLKEEALLATVKEEPMLIEQEITIDDKPSLDSNLATIQLTTDLPADIIRINHEYQTKSFNKHLDRRRGALTERTNFPFLFQTHNLVEENYRWMNEDIYSRIDAMRKRVEFLSQKILEEYNQKFINKPEEKLPNLPIGSVSQTPALFIGRVVSDSEGKLNVGSIMIENANKNNSKSTKAYLLLSLMKECYFALGQVVGVVGTTDDSGSSIYVTEIIYGCEMPAKQLPASELRTIRSYFASQNYFFPIHVMCCSGPYHISSSTLDGNFIISFKPLLNLLERAKEEKPHVLILLGHFLSCNDVHIQNKILLSEEGEPINYWDLMNDFVFPRLHQFSIQNKDIEVIVVPHLDDAVHSFPIPQPPFDTKEYFLSGAKGKTNNIHFLSNPSTVTIGDVNISLTSYDAARPAQFFFYGSSGSIDRQSVIVQQAFSQKSLFWMNPTLDTPIEPSMEKLLTFGYKGNAEPDVILTRATQIAPGAMKVGEDKICVIAGSPAHKAIPTVTNMFIHPPQPIPMEVEGKNLIMTKAADRIRVDTELLVV